METKVVTAVACSEALRNEFKAWFQAEFGQTPWKWATPDYYILAYAEGDLIARLGVVERVISVGNELIRIGGVSGVVTRQQSRGKGVALSLLSKARSFLRNQLGVPFGLLLCRNRLRTLYEKAGWQEVHGPVRFAQPTGSAEYPHLAMVLRCGEEDWPAAKIDLQGLPW